MVIMRLRIALVGLLLISRLGEAQAQNWRAFLSPGPVGASHERISGTCDRCHLVFKGVPDEKCLVCHAAIESRLRSGKGFHAAERERACVQCHVDHKGADHPMINKAAKAAFDHGRTTFPLREAHAKLKCAQCHNKPLAKMKESCLDCHEDSHKGAVGDRCQDCHGAAGWRVNLKNLSDHKVRMDGGHTGLTCVKCHAKGEHLKKEVACADCHDKAHGGTNEACSGCHSVLGFKPAKFDHDLCPCAFPGKHKEASCLKCHQDFKFTNTPTLCSGCHQKDLTHDPLGECSVCHSPFSWKKNRFNHNRQSRFKLENDHLEVDCFRCHTQKRGRKRLFRGAPKDCYSCHQADGVEAHGDFGNCAKCHTTEGFERSTFDHASTGFALDGRHTKIECQDCHAKKTEGYPKRRAVPPLPKPPKGKKGKKGATLQRETKEAYALFLAAVTGQAPPQPHSPISRDERACVHCHNSPHQGTTNDQCSGCHSTQTWRPSTFDLKRHERTKFPLQGAHQKAKCNLCHVDRKLKGQPTECAGCHLDIHQGRFGEDCARCHDESAFKPAPKFNHATTGFALQGPHGRVACASCHGGGKQKDLTKSEAPRACASCHAPGHGPELGQDCASCHPMSDGAFANAKRDRFDHGTTAFPLERRHQLLACKRCHPAPVEGRAQMAPTGRCGTCHLDPHKGNNSNDCVMCHEPDRWRLARFDHDAAGWPLRGRHSVAPCASCHTNQRWFGLTTDCFDCHALDAARGASIAPGAHPFGRLECTDCHFSGWTWRMR